MVKMVEEGARGGNPAGEGRHSDSMRARAANAKSREGPDRNPELPQRKPTALERIHNMNRQNIIDDLTMKARLHPERKMDPALLNKARELMQNFSPIENSIDAEVEKFRNGTYSIERPEEYAAAADRVRLAMYLVDKIKEMYAKVLERDSDSLLEVFVLAARGIQNMLSGNYFHKTGWQLIAPGDWGYLDLRVEPPFVACAQATGVRLLPLNKEIYLEEFLEKIGAR